MSAQDVSGYLAGAALGAVLIVLMRAFLIWWSVAQGVG